MVWQKNALIQSCLQSIYKKCSYQWSVLYIRIRHAAVKHLIKNDVIFQYYFDNNVIVNDQIQQQVRRK